MREALSVQGLEKIYAGGEGPAGGVRDAAFELAPGTFFTLLGPSGCGKTTTLRCIAGLETPDRGRIALGERVFFDAAGGVNVALNRRRIGMVFQSYAIWPHMSVFENVAFPLRVARGERFDRAAIGRMVGRALETVDLAGFGERSATRLSGGQQQRVALARAIVREPSLLLLDEPLSNLDAALREDMRVELKRLQQQIGVTTIYVTHDQSEALDMSDRIAVLQGGRVVQMGSPRDIYFRPRNAFVAGFVGATNLVRGRVDAAVAAGALGAVTLESGMGLRCLFPQAGVAGAGIAVSIRPECFVLDEGANGLPGVVVSAGFQGSSNRYGVRVGDAVLHMTTGPETQLAVGVPVGLRVLPENAIALPEETP